MGDMMQIAISWDLPKIGICQSQQAHLSSPQIRKIRSLPLKRDRSLKPWNGYSDVRKEGRRGWADSREGRRFAFICLEDSEAWVERFGGVILAALDPPAAGRSDSWEGRRSNSIGLEDSEARAGGPGGFGLAKVLSTELSVSMGSEVQIRFYTLD